MGHEHVLVICRMLLKKEGQRIYFNSNKIVSQQSNLTLTYKYLAAIIRVSSLQQCSDKSTEFPLAMSSLVSQTELYLIQTAKVLALALHVTLLSSVTTKLRNRFYAFGKTFCNNRKPHLQQVHD